MLAEARRLLRPGGRVFVHTMPNRLLYDVTYRLHRGIMNTFGSRWPTDPRSDFEHAMHINEQSLGGLRAALSDAEFRRVRVTLGRWVFTEFLPDARHARLYHWAARVPGLRRIVLADMFGTGWR